AGAGRGQHAAPGARSARTNGVEAVPWSTHAVVPASSANAVVGLASGSIARVDRQVAVRHPFAARVASMKPWERSCAWGHSLSRPQLGWVMPILDPHDVR